MAKEGTPPITPELRTSLIEAMTHPVRNAVFCSVAGRPGVTAGEIAGRLEISARSVRHHLDRLLAAGLIETSAESARRNTRVHHYSVVVAPFVERGETLELSDEEQRQIALSVLRLLIADARSAVTNRSFGTRAGHMEARVPSRLDERGWQESSVIMTRALEELMTVCQSSAERLLASGEEGIEAMSALLLFEARPWRQPE
jgi:DNA-binding transcriptional ArsR family regulator